jgi:hypothetical protein
MNEGKAQKLKAESGKRLVNDVSLTTSHSFKPKRRSDVWSAIATSPISTLSRRNERRGLGVVRIGETDCGVEFHVESPTTASHLCDEFSKNSNEMVSSLRIKVTSDLGAVNGSPKDGIRRCQEGLRHIESSLEWITADSPLSITYYYDSKKAGSDFSQQCISGFTVIIFDGKLRVRRVARNDVNKALRCIPNLMG